MTNPKDSSLAVKASETGGFTNWTMAIRYGSGRGLLRRKGQADRTSPGLMPTRGQMIIVRGSKVFDGRRISQGIIIVGDAEERIVVMFTIGVTQGTSELSHSLLLSLVHDAMTNPCHVVSALFRTTSDLVYCKEAGTDPKRRSLRRNRVGSPSIFRH